MLEVVIDSLGSGGDGVARLPDGEVVFVAGGLPGDKLAIRLEQRRKKVQHATIKSIIEPSPDRVVGRCRIDTCGGCSLRDYRDEAESNIKEQRIRETLRRVGGVDWKETIPVTAVGDSWNYRHRVRLHANWHGSVWHIGYHARRSHELAAFGGCSVLWPELDEVVRRVSRAVLRLPTGLGLREVSLAYSRKLRRAAASLSVVGDLQKLRQTAAQLGEDASLYGVELRRGEELWQWGNLELAYDHGAAEDFELNYEAGMFTQANPAVNDSLVDAVVEATTEGRPSSVLELHAGVGNLSIPLAKAGMTVCATELNRRACTFGARNAKSAWVDVTFACIVDEEAVHEAADKDVLVMDPPRTGAKGVCQTVARPGSGPQRVVYVSCDPATLARDIAILREGGYHLRRVAGFDMFPQTPHVETIAVLER